MSENPYESGKVPAGKRRRRWLRYGLGALLFLLLLVIGDYQRECRAFSEKTSYFSPMCTNFLLSFEIAAWATNEPAGSTG